MAQQKIIRCFGSEQRKFVLNDTNTLPYMNDDDDDDDDDDNSMVTSTNGRN